MSRPQAPPRKAVVEGHGVCRVLGYRGHGRFIVRKPDSTTQIVHRGQIRFIKKRKEEAA